MTVNHESNIQAQESSAPSKFTLLRRIMRLSLTVIVRALVIVLLLMMIDLGRVFYAWLVLQNAATMAVRYASTGKYDSEKYDVDLFVPCYAYDTNLPRGTVNIPIYTPPEQPPAEISVNVFLPQLDVLPSNLLPPDVDFEVVAVSEALLNAGNGQSGSRQIIFNGYPRRAYEDIYHESGVRVLKRGQGFTAEAVTVLSGQQVKVFALNPDESLYATWYGRDRAENDCYPTDDSLNDRRDMLRLPSIYDAARREAVGLQLEPSLTGDGTRREFLRFLRDFWSNPSPRQTIPGWFNVMICSSREQRYPEGESVIMDNSAGQTLRFDTFYGQGLAYTRSPLMPGGACLLKERPDASIVESYLSLLDNYNHAWADAGDAGDVVRVMITYNHPLMFLPGQYVQLQARRSTRNESFRLRTGEGHMRVSQ